MNAKKQTITILALSIIFVVSFAPAGFCCDGILGCIGAGASAVGGALKDGAVAVGEGIADGASAVGGAIGDGAEWLLGQPEDHPYPVAEIKTKEDCLSICKSWFENAQNCINSCDNMALCGTYAEDNKSNAGFTDSDKYPGTKCANMSKSANLNLEKNNPTIELDNPCIVKSEDELRKKIEVAVTQKRYGAEFVIAWEDVDYEDCNAIGTNCNSNPAKAYYRNASWAYDRMCMTGIEEYKDGSKYIVYKVVGDKQLEFQYNEENNGWGNKDANGKWVPGGWKSTGYDWCNQPDRECIIKKKIEITNDITLTSPLEILKQDSVGYARPAEVEIVGKKKSDGKLPVIKLSDNFKAGDSAAIVIEDGEHNFVISGIKFKNVDIDFDGGIFFSKLTVKNSEFENTDAPLKPVKNWTLVDNLFAGSAPFISLQGEAQDNMIIDNDFSASAEKDAIEVNTAKKNIILENKYSTDKSVKVSAPSQIGFTATKSVPYGGKIAGTSTMNLTCTSYPYCFELTFTKPQGTPIAAVELYKAGKRISLMCNPYYEKDIIKAVNSAKLAGSNKLRSLKNACDQWLGVEPNGTKIVTAAPYETFSTQDIGDLWGQWVSKKGEELDQNVSLQTCKKDAADIYYASAGSNDDWYKYNDALKKCSKDAGWCDVWAQYESMCQSSTCDNKVTSNCPTDKQYPPEVTPPDNKITAIFHSGEWMPIGSPINVLSFTPEGEIDMQQVETQWKSVVVTGMANQLTALNNAVTEEGCFDKAKTAQESACEKYRCGDDGDCMAKCVLANACNEFNVYCVPDVNLESDVYKENCLDENGEGIHRGDGFKRYLPPPDGGDELKCASSGCECPVHSHLSAAICVCDDDYEDYGGSCVEVCKDGKVRDATGQCACPAGTEEKTSGFTTSCEAPPAPPECSGDSDCSDGKLCKDGICVNPDDPGPLGGECKVTSDCGIGMICASTEKCECDINNNYSPSYAGAKTCEYKEPAIGSICELNGGQYLQERCIYNKNEAICIEGGGAWEGGACVTPEEPSADAGGCSCTLASKSTPANGMGTALAYLSMLGSLLFMRARRAKLSH